MRLYTIRGRWFDRATSVVCLLLLATVKRAGAQTQAQPCPLDRTLLGYTSLETINEDMKTGQKSHSKTIIATAGTVIAGLLSTVVVILMKMPG